jgi:hypothetical protein
MNWQQLAATSHYQTAVSVAETLAAGDVAEASAGLQELIDAVARSERRALRSQLVRLMVHILKWHCQPDKRTPNWSVSIYQAREEIASIREEVPSLNREAIEAIWTTCFRTAKKQAQAEIRERIRTAILTWNDVFEMDYFLTKETERPAHRPTKGR